MAHLSQWMETPPRLALILAASLCVVLLGGPASPGPPPASASAGGMARMIIDMDPEDGAANGPGTFAPVNDWASFGTIQECARINENDILDADEDVLADRVTLDVLADDIPAATAMFGGEARISYDDNTATGLQVVAVNSTTSTVAGVAGDMMVMRTPGSSSLALNDPLPDNNNDGAYMTGSADIEPDTREYGDGVLFRLAIASRPGTPSGVYDLTLDPVFSLHTDPESNQYFPDVLVNGKVAVGQPCPASSDTDGIPTDVELACGSDPYSNASIPERTDGAFAGVDDDGDALIDEALPGGSAGFDCDGDGYAGSTEAHVYATGGGTAPDQDPCGGGAAPGWPADLAGGGNKLDISDVLSFVAPVNRLGSGPGDPNYSVRWDLVPSPTINITDLLNLITVAPGMTGGQRAYGLTCPWPP